MFIGVFFSCSHEGRSWYSAHRGPLWIAAAAKVAEEGEIIAVEAEYVKRGKPHLSFLFMYLLLIMIMIMIYNGKK